MAKLIKLRDDLSPARMEEFQRAIVAGEPAVEAGRRLGIHPELARRLRDHLAKAGVRGERSWKSDHDGALLALRLQGCSFASIAQKLMRTEDECRERHQALMAEAAAEGNLPYRPQETTP